MGELLDAAASVLAPHLRVMLPFGLALAGIEQALLYPIAYQADLLYDVEGRGFDWVAVRWVMIVVGLGLESLIIALLAGVAARAAVGVLLGTPAKARELMPDRRYGGVIALAAILGLLASVGAAFCYLPWVVVYGLFGLAVPALMIDGVGPFAAMTRSAKLVLAGGGRAGGIRLLGYLGWLILRLGAGWGGYLALDSLFDFRGTTAVLLATSATWLLIDAVAYPALACLDAVLHLENRMRVEGLDITISRTLARGEPVEGVLGAPVAGPPNAPAGLQNAALRGVAR